MPRRNGQEPRSQPAAKRPTKEHPNVCSNFQQIRQDYGMPWGTLLVVANSCLACYLLTPFRPGSDLIPAADSTKPLDLALQTLRFVVPQAEGALSVRLPKDTKEEDPQPELQRLHANMMQAEKEATGARRSLATSKLWLQATMAMDAHLVATGAPANIRAYTLSEIQRIALHHFPWNSLLGFREMLQNVAAALATRMLEHDEISRCCSSSGCLHDQVSTVMIFEELGMSDAAIAHLQSVKAALIANGENPFCRAMGWDLNRLAAPLDIHFPRGYDSLVDVARAPAFWSQLESPMAQYLEEHSQVIVAELAPLCAPEQLLTRPGYFGSERVVSDLSVRDSWTSLPLLTNGVWNTSACGAVAPRTCDLLRTRAELQDAMRSSSSESPDTIVQYTLVSVYRLRPQSRIHRHVGTQWRLNTHLGLVTPPGAEIRVWNETLEWEVGKALTFLDAAEHDVTHNGNTDRCVLNVVSWHPAVLERRLSDASFDELFVSADAWAAAEVEYA